MLLFSFDKKIAIFLRHLAAPMLASGLAIATPQVGENIASILHFCASRDAAATIACCKANESRLPLPLATGNCETSTSCSVIQGMGAAGGPNCRLNYGPQILDLLKPDAE